MDIRRFFGGGGAAPKKSAENLKPKPGGKKDEPKSKTPTSQKDSASKKSDPKTKKKTPTTTKPAKTTPQKSSSSRKSSSPKKPTQKKSKLEEDDEAVIIDDSDGDKVDDDDDEVIRSSLEKPTKSAKGTAKVNGSFSSSEKAKPGGKAKKTEDKEKKNKKKNVLASSEEEEEEEAIVIDNTPSEASSSSSRKSRREKPKPDVTPKKSAKKSSSQTQGVSPSPVRSSPRKGNSVTKANGGDKKEAGARHKDGKSKKKLSDDELEPDGSDTEDVIVSRRSRGRPGQKSKGSSRILDSDSDENPLPDEKPKAKRKKKDVVVYESDEEKKETAIDKFVIHKGKKPVHEESGKKKETTPAGKPVSVADFFGSGTVARVERHTAVAKRKHEEVDTKADKEIDLTFDEEMHDDDDFLKTLDQLDGPNVKKMKPSESGVENKSEKTTGGSLASKLSSKMKSVPKEEIVGDQKKNTEKDGKGQGGKRSLSPAKTKSPPTVKKGKVYTMEVERTKPATVVVSPGKSKSKMAEETPPPKGKTSKATSAQKPANDDDDGFGPKVIKGFNAFKTRGGPQALGSKDVPEGADNCLEGLTFVITGVLDSIERDDAKSLIEKHGGKVTGSISKKTGYVVIGREPGESKLAKARQLGVKQIDEDGLFDLVRTLPGKTSKYELQAKEQLKKEATIKAAEVKEREKQEAAAKKLESFRSDKDKRSSPSPKKGESLFTSIKDSSEATAAPSGGSPAKAAKLLGQSDVSSEKKSGPSSQPQTLLWVDKHKPTSLKQIIGQQGDKSNAKKLLNWMKAWHENIIVKGLKPSGNFFGKGDGTGCRAALLSGPPGIGKTTTATLVCKDLGFSYVELNASDTRSKKSLKEVVAESLNNQTLVDYVEPASTTSSHHHGQSHCLIMDEVDGMAGNEDRGGLQELVQLIKSSKIPIICICNDRNSMKMRTLANYCLDLRFQRPRLEQIKGAMMSIAFKEGLKIPAPALNEIILASHQDIRQVIHNMSVWSATDKNLTFDQVKADAKKAQKDVKLGPFDVCRKVFVDDDETRKFSISDKSDLFFHDYSFGPLFVHENYINIQPNKAKGSKIRHLSCLSRTIDAISDGDLVDKLIRKEGNWNLLPTQAMYSSVIPGEVMRGSFPQMTDFPQWLGKFSTTNKTHRILQELGTHMRLEISCDKRSLTLDYLPALRACLTSPLTSQGADGVPDVIKVMDDYDIVKEDFDNVLEVTKWPGGSDPMSKLDPKTKAAFTRQYNKQIHMTPYATGISGKKRKARGQPMEETDFITEEGEENGGTAATQAESDEEEGGIETDSMIKTKKPTASKIKSNSTPSSSKGKGKGAGKGSGKGKR